MRDERDKITGVVLAGGRGRRMGGADKGLLDYRGHPLVAYALDALRESTGPILINANRHTDEYARFGYPVIPDLNQQFDGPLAGLLSAMRAACTDYVLTVPCDCPQVNGRLLRRLYRRLLDQQADICAAHDGQRLHSVFLLAECRLADDLAAYLAGGGRKVEAWLRSRRLAVADYSDNPGMFANINTLEDLTGEEGG